MKRLVIYLKLINKQTIINTDKENATINTKKKKKKNMINQIMQHANKCVKMLSSSNLLCNILLRVLDLNC